MNKTLRKIWTWVVSSYLNAYGKIILWQMLRHVDKTDKPLYQLYETVLSNQIRYTNQPGFEIGKDDPYLLSKNMKSLILNITKLVLDELIILQNFIGIQVTNTPVTYIFTLRHHEQNVFKINKAVVEALSRKLYARWDLEATSPGDTGRDRESIMASEIACEIVQEFVNKITHGGRDLGSTNVDKLADKIRETRNSIGDSVKRGHANFMIVDPITLVQMQAPIGVKNSNVKFIPNEDRSGRLSYAGDWVDVVDGKPLPPIKVFVNLLQTDPMVLMGYRGITETDVGCVYCPYVLLMTTGIVMDPTTSTPHLTFMTRYGSHHDESDLETYFAKFTVNSEKEVK